MLDGEMKKLMAVPTTHNEARRILMRNVALLWELERVLPIILDGNIELEFDWIVQGASTYNITYGCPHCKNCDKCAWQKYVLTDEQNEKHKNCLLCYFATFYGVSLLDLVKNELFLVKYGDDYAELAFFHFRFERAVKDVGRDDAVALFMAEIEDCRKFLKGHIEWAEAKMANPDPEQEKEE